MKTFMRRSFMVLAAWMLLVPTAHAQQNSADAGYLQEAKEPSGYVAPDASRSPVRAEGEGYLSPPPNLGNSGGYLSAQTKSVGGADGDSFVAAPAGSTEQINGGRLMLLAYAGFWLLALAYIASLASRARTANKELLELRRELQELDDRLEDLESGRV